MYYLIPYKMPIALRRWIRPLRYPARIETSVQVIYSQFTSNRTHAMAWFGPPAHIGRAYSDRARSASRPLFFFLSPPLLKSQE